MKQNGRVDITNSTNNADLHVIDTVSFFTTPSLVCKRKSSLYNYKHQTTKKIEAPHSQLREPSLMLLSVLPEAATTVQKGSRQQRLTKMGAELLLFCEGIPMLQTLGGPPKKRYVNFGSLRMFQLSHQIGLTFCAICDLFVFSARDVPSLQRPGPTEPTIFGSKMCSKNGSFLRLLLGIFQRAASYALCGTQLIIADTVAVGSRNGSVGVSPNRVTGGKHGCFTSGGSST